MDGVLMVAIGQDAGQIPEGNYEYVTWTAAQGHGFIIGSYDKTGILNVRKSPSTNAPIVARILGNKNHEGYPDDEYPCLGVSGNWYKIKVNGKIGYIRKDLADWSISSCFAGGEIR